MTGVEPDSVDPVRVHSRGSDPEEKAERKSASTLLVEIAEEMYDFGVSDTGETFGLPRSGPMVVRLLRGGKTSLRSQLSREYFRRFGKAAPQQALADALLVIEGVAQDTDESQLYQRVGHHRGDWWLDLGDPTGRAVRITRQRWTLEPSPAVLFKRTALNSPLPEPASGADLGDLWGWLNVTEADRPLVAAWLVAALVCDIPHPILSISGEQGVGKSTAEKVLVSVLDPSPVPTRKPPRDADSWVTAAAGSWVVGLDNLSDIQPWLSDSLCRAVTGDGDVRRKLYTDGDVAVFAFRRCLILNGIDLGAVRGDLADRLLPVHLEVIDESKRLTETELWPMWTEAHPRILGAVLDLAASVKTALPSVRLDRKPRMADYAELLAAVDMVLGTAGLPRYLVKQGELAADSLSGDPFVSALAEAGAALTGTAAEILVRATPAREGWRAPKGWPANPRQVTQRLRRQAPVLRKAGWEVVDDGGANHSNTVRWTLTPPRRPEMAGIGDSHDSHDSQGASVASHASEEYGPSQDGEAATRVPAQLTLVKPDESKPCDTCRGVPSRKDGMGARYCQQHAPHLWRTA